LIGGHVSDADYLDSDLPLIPDLVTVACGTNDLERAFEPQVNADGS